MAKTKILPAITTFHSDWRAKIKEVDGLELKEVALFPTVLDTEERKEYYDLIAKTDIKSIPHIHIRDDFEEWELDMLTNDYGAKVFNTHANPNTPALLERCAKYKDRIYIENGFKIDSNFFEQAGMCGGICIDFSHWADARLMKWRGYKEFEESLAEYRIGCAHLSAVLKFPVENAKYGMLYNSHHAKAPENYSYLKDFRQHLPEFASIELTNPLAFQLEVKRYIEENIIK